MPLQLKQTVEETHRLESYPKFAEEAMRKAANAFIDGILPKHFTQAGADEYHYEERSPAYNASKLRRFGHQIPFVKTGGSERQSRSSTVRVLGQGHRGRSTASAVVRIPVSAANFSRERRREIKATSKRDGAILAVEITNVLTARLNETEAPREIR